MAEILNLLNDNEYDYVWPKVFDKWLPLDIEDPMEKNVPFTAKTAAKFESTVQGYQYCVFCPNIIKSSHKASATDKVTGLTMAIQSHLIDNHKHLMFECKSGNCSVKNSQQHAYHPNENFEIISYFATYEALKEHIEVHHNFSASDRARHRITPDKSKVDLRKATCEICKKVFLCQGYYQLEKHNRLAHASQKNKFTLACRVCNFKTYSNRNWHLHFYKGYRGCLSSSKLNDAGNCARNSIKEIILENKNNENIQNDNCNVVDMSLGSVESTEEKNHEINSIESSLKSLSRSTNNRNNTESIAVQSNPSFVQIQPLMNSIKCKPHDVTKLRPYYFTKLNPSLNTSNSSMVKCLKQPIPRLSSTEQKCSPENPLPLMKIACNSPIAKTGLKSTSLTNQESINFFNEPFKKCTDPVESNFSFVPKQSVKNYVECKSHDVIKSQPYHFFNVNPSLMNCQTSKSSTRTRNLKNLIMVNCLKQPFPSTAAVKEKSLSGKVIPVLVNVGHNPTTDKEFKSNSKSNQESMSCSNKPFENSTNPQNVSYTNKTANSKTVIDDPHDNFGINKELKPCISNNSTEKSSTISKCNNLINDAHNFEKTETSTDQDLKMKTLLKHAFFPKKSKKLS